MSDKHVIMVDPYTSSERICDAFLEQGIYPIAILTDKLAVPEETKRFRLPLNKFKKIYQYDEETRQDLIRECQKLNVLHVISGCEMSNDVADSIAKSLCPDTANTLETVKNRMDKYAMQEAVRTAGLNAVKQCKISTRFLSEAQKELLRSFDFPVVVKPTGANGTFGVFYCNQLEEVEAVLEKMVGIYYPRYGVTVDTMVVQECLQGTEYLIDTVSWGGEHQIVNVASYHKTLHNGRPVYRNATAVDLQTIEAQTCINYLKGVLTAVGVQYGLAHTEIFLTEKGPYLVEVNPRVSGAFGYLNKLSKYMYGYDQADVLLHHLLAPPSSLEKEKKKIYQYGTILFIQSWQEKEMKDFVADKITALPSYKEHKVVKKIGQPLATAGELGDVVALVALFNNDQKQLEKDMAIINALELNGELF